MKRERPIIYISHVAYRKTLAEADKYYRLGLEKEKAPYECALFPLSSLLLKEGLEKSPLELVDLDEIEGITIPFVLIPPTNAKRYAPSKAAFIEHNDGGREASLDFNRRIARVIDKYPRLTLIGRMHTHPWEKADRLSLGDKFHIFHNTAWLVEKGFNTALNIVLSRKGDGWVFNAYGLDRNFNHLELPIVFVSNDHEIIRGSLQGPAFYDTKEGDDWIVRNLEELEKSGVLFDENFLKRQWKRFIIWLDREGSEREEKENNTGKRIFICLPPLFPKERARVLEIVDIKKNIFKPLALPKGSSWEQKKESIALSEYSFLEIVRYYSDEYKKTRR